MKIIPIYKMINEKVKTTVLSLFTFCLIPFFTSAQVSTAIDSMSIQIGSKITYQITVDTDTINSVVFPEGQTFLPLESIESFPVDTTKKGAKYKLIKRYGLTQFDSGKYTIPRQKININGKVVLSDSAQVEVRNIVVDTTKQGLYDIKPIIEVKKQGSDWWKTVLGVLLGLALVAFLLYWFLWREKPLSEEEKIALLPPYDRAKLALKSLDESNFLQQEKLKDYYSELTYIIRKYLDEKVYDRALESTTDELVDRLNVLKDGNQIDISKDDIRNIETILKRADLVKFAKSAPDVELAKIDRNTIDLELDQVKEALPEPTEEEKLLDEQYKIEQEAKQKRKKVMYTVGISVFLLLATLTGFGIKYGFGYVKDTIIGHESKALLEGEWVTSAYGFPPVTISTPKVLQRTVLPVPEEQQGLMTMNTFIYGTLLDEFSVLVNTINFKQDPQQQQKQEIDLNQVAEGSIKGMEAQGAKDIVVLQDKFSTPNGAEGVKVHGTLKTPILKTEKYKDANYVLFLFTSEAGVLQQIMITYPKDDTYADKIIERITSSLELIQKEEKNKK